MNKFFTKIAAATVGFAMAIGVGVGVSVNDREAKEVYAANSGTTASDGTFVIDFYDDTKLSSTSGTGLTNSNYSDFVSVYTGLTETDVVTGVSVTGTVQFGKNGGLTAGTNTAASANSHYVTFTIGDDYAVNKCTVYATAYEAGRWLLNDNEADSGSLGSKGAAFASITEPLVWDNLGGLKSLTFKKDNGSGGNQKRLTIYTIVCDYSSSSGADPVKLSAPEDLVANGTVLSWTGVENNNGYSYSINTNPETTGNIAKNATSFDTNTLPLSSGNYTFKLKAKGNGTTFLDSDYCDAVPFTMPEYVVDTITAADLAATSTTYVEFSVEGASGATYVGYSAKNGGNIQFNTYSSPKNRSIATSFSAGYIRKVSVVWGNDNGSEFTVYAGDEAYSSSTVGTSGTAQIKTLSELNTFVAIAGNQEFVSLVPNGAIYPASISFYWDQILKNQTISASTDSAREDETITVSSDAEKTVSWSVVEGAGTTASGASVTSAGVVSVTGPGTVTVKASANGYNDATKQVTFTAKPVGNYYTITFNEDGGSVSTEDKNVFEGETFVFPSAGTKEHYTFLGWTEDGITFYDEGDTSPAVHANADYLAWWEEDAKYTVTYVAGANGSGSYSDNDNYAETYTLLPFNNLTGVSAADGYRFKNYTVGGVNKDAGETFELSGATEVTVNFEIIPLEYQVVFGTAEGTTPLSDPYWSNGGWTIPSGVTLSGISGNVYGNITGSGSAIRFGKSGSTGSFDATISDDLYITKVTASLKYYGSDSTAKFAVTPSGGEPIETSLTNAFKNYEFDVSAARTNKITLGTTVNSKRAFIAGFTIEYAEYTAKQTVEAITTSTSLAYRYNKDGEGNFTYSDISIRFGAAINKDLWSELDTDSHLITGFGVIIADAEMVTNDDDMADAVEDAVPSTTSTDIYNNIAVDYFVSIENMATTIAEEGNNYFWNLRWEIDSSDMSKVYSATAYIKVGNRYFLLKMAKESVKTLAQDYLDNRDCDGTTADGSLQNIVK